VNSGGWGSALARICRLLSMTSMALPAPEPLRGTFSVVSAGVGAAGGAFFLVLMILFSDCGGKPPNEEPILRSRTRLSRQNEAE
jgi:hypothetical protein